MRLSYCVLGSLLGIACTSMRNVEPDRFIPRHKPLSVSVWTAPDSVTVVSDPRIDGDTLRGVVLQAPWAAPLKGIVKVEAVAPDPTKTALLITAAVASVVGMAIIASSGKQTNGRPECPDNDVILC
jgi:hypothetical protein